MLLLTRKDMEEVFTMKEAIEAVKLAYSMFSQGKIEVPLRSAITAPNGGTFLTMPAFSEELGVHCVKYCNHFVENREKGLPTLPTKILMASMEDGMIFTMMEGLYVTQMRTGAASGAAFALLAKEDCRKGALFGTGSMASAQLEAMLSARDLKLVHVYSPNQESLQRFVEEKGKDFSLYGAKIVAAESPEEAVEDADLIITATPSKQPVFDGRILKPGATVSGVGSFTPEMQELSPFALQRASKVYFDSMTAVLAESGDLLQPLHAGQISDEQFMGDLGDVILGKLPGRESDEEIILFKSVGLAAQDLVTAKWIYDKALEAGVGTHWEE